MVFIGKIRQLLIVGVKYLLGVRIASFPLKRNENKKNDNKNFY